MKTFSRFFNESINVLANLCTRQDTVIATMKRTMQQTMRYIHALHITDLYKELLKHNLTTTNILSLSKQLCNTLPERRRNTLASMITRWKLTDAYDVLREERYNNTRSWRECKRTLQEHNVMKQFMELHKKERSRYRSELIEQRKQKLDFYKRRCKTGRTIPSKVGDIIIDDQELTNKYSSEPRIYGGATINEKELQLLSLPPKFTITENINIERCEAEVEKGLAKLRWERLARKKEEERKKYGGDSVIGKGEEGYYNKKERKINLTKMKATDLPFNRKVYLPKPLEESE